MKLSKSEAGKLGYAVSGAKLRHFAVLKHDRAVAEMADRRCPRCEITIPIAKRDNIYCSRACSIAARVSRIRICGCGKIIKSYVTRTCSKTCTAREVAKEKTLEWLEGRRVGGSWYGVHQWVREWLILQKGECCWQCGWREVHPTTGKIPIQVDHIDGNPNNHAPHNLRLLCPNCHSLTPNYGALNRGRGRTERYSGVVQRQDARL